MTRTIKMSKGVPIRLVLVMLLLIATITVGATDTSSSAAGGSGTRAARRLGESATTLFPCVYTAVLPKLTDNDPTVALVQSFVAQLDMLKEVPHDDNSKVVEPAFLVRNAVELKALQHSFSTMMVAVTGTSEEVYTLYIHDIMTAELRVQLDRKSSSLQKRQQPSPYSTIADFPCYKNIQGTFDWMAAMVTKAETFPNLSITLTDIGDSYLKKTNATGGYDIMAMKITGNGAGPNVTKAVFFAMTGLHAREYAPPELASRWAERLIDAYIADDDADITAMLDRTEIHLVLQANPDGRHVAETDRPVFRRKNMNPSGSSLQECEDVGGQIGVDLNRNFPFQWGLDSGSSSDKCGQTYRGIAPASEPEVKAIVDYCASIYPQEQRKGNPLVQQQQPYDESSTMGVFFDIHAYGSVMIWPWVSYAI
jgi:murein tripeptide amidase MpaA